MKLTLSAPKPAATPAPAKEQKRKTSDKEIAFIWLLDQLENLAKSTEAPNENLKDILIGIASPRRLKDTHVESIGRHVRGRIARFTMPIEKLLKKRGLI
jgi:hypothetical protein